MKVSENCLSLIKKFEGCKLEPYLDAVGIPTIGYGSIFHSDGVTRVSIDDEAISEEEAENRLLIHLNAMFASIEHAVEVSLEQNQADALASLVYNIGIGNFRHSTLLKQLNAGNFERAADQFLVWNKAGGKVLAGLTRRRKEERELFLAE
jgi:lysozyme